MKRRAEWRQDTPKMQMTALLAALEGNLSNLCNGVIAPERMPEIHERCLDLFRQTHELNAANCRSWDSFEALVKDPDRR